MYHGNSHTGDPQWIRRFKKRNFTILSVILDVSLETCIGRVEGRGDSLSDDTIKGRYLNFHNNLRLIFKEKAIKEKTIEPRTRDLELLTTEVLDNS